MPQWAGSCWYYLRYLDPRNDTEIFAREAYDDWMPIDLYVGGSEHAVLHLLYARFWHKVLFDVGVVKHPEPFTKLVHQGTILGTLFRYYTVTGAAGRVLAGDDPDVVPADADPGFKLKSSGAAVEACWAKEEEVVWSEGVAKHQTLGVRVIPVTEKMSKSRGNVVNPDSVIGESGADSLRVYEMFMGPLEQMKPWHTSGIQGVRRFLDRMHTVATRALSEGPGELETQKLVHRTVKKVGEDIDALRMNTAVSAMMILVNHLNGLESPPKSAVEALVLCVSPVAPHLAEELWEKLGHPPSVSDAPWPAFDPSLCEDDAIEIGVQVNGKVRGRVLLPKAATEDEAKRIGLADPNVAKFIEG
jgi:leucyl-tRNA synthetase